MKRNHYETLGVDKTASPDEIKRARRKRAREVHPDLNPETSEEDIKQINHAADVLLDPNKRQLYDATGQEQTKGFDDEVRNLILMFFNDALQKNATRCLDHVRFLLSQQTNQIRMQRSQATEMRERMITKRDKIKVKEGVNLFHQLIDTNIVQLAAQIAQFDRAERIAEAAKELLDLYESEEEAEKAPDLRITFGLFQPVNFEETAKTNNHKKRKAK